MTSAHRSPHRRAGVTTAGVLPPVPRLPFPPALRHAAGEPRSAAVNREDPPHRPARYRGGPSGRLAQLVERRSYKADVGGSSPSTPTPHAGSARRDEPGVAEPGRRAPRRSPAGWNVRPRSAAYARTRPPRAPAVGGDHTGCPQRVAARSTEVVQAGLGDRPTRPGPASRAPAGRDEDASGARRRWRPRAGARASRRSLARKSTGRSSAADGDRALDQDRPRLGRQATTGGT